MAGALSYRIPNDFPVLNADGSVAKPTFGTQVQPQNVAGGPQSTAAQPMGSTPSPGAASQSPSNTWLASGGAQAPSYGTSGVGAAPVAAGRGPQWDAFYQQLLGRSTQSLTPNANDPVIRAQTDAFRSEQLRNQLRQQSALAEKAGPNTNLAAENRAMGEQAGQATSAEQARLLGQEVTARRAEIAQALGLQAGQLTTEEASRLRQEDQALAARAQDIQNSQFGANLGLQHEQLGQQESQFGRSFGLAANQQDWMQAFQDKGWTADQAQRAWDDQYKTLFG